MRRILVGVVGVSLLAAACASGDDNQADSSAEESEETTETTVGLGSALEADDSPLPVLVVAEDVAESGVPVNPAASFPDTAPQMVAIAFAAEAGTVTFTWSQVPDEGEPTELFSHEVALEAGQVAFSTGTSPGVLAAGTYRVEAAAGDDEEVVEFAVESSSGDGNGGGATTGTAGRAAQAPGGAGPPQPGESGTRVLDPDDDSVAGVFLVPWTPDPDATEVMPVLYTFRARDAAQPYSVKVTAASGGERLSRTVTSAEPEHYLALDPCRLGHDLPGTEVAISLDVVEDIEANVGALASSGAVEAGSGPFTIVLGPDTTKPILAPFDSGPRPGSTVEAGDTIGFDVIARDQKREGSSWQTGVQLLQVLADDEVVGEPENGPRLPPKCDEAKRVLNLQGEYEVPNDPPPIIKLCAVAEDYAGNVGTKCHEYYTGEVWKGTYEGQVEVAGCTPTPQSGELTLVVNDDGNVAGTDPGTRTGEYSCEEAGVGGTIPGSRSAPYTFTGTKTRGAFTLDWYEGPLELVISGSRATGTYTPSAPAYGSIAVNLECVTCE